MPSIQQKQPLCPYGRHVKYVCINSNCKKPAFVCQNGQNTKSQCWLFHQNCNKAKWSELQAFSKQNSLIKTPQFMHLQQRIDNLFLNTLQKVQTQHQKFKTWLKTYGHSLEAMKFIKLLMDRNYEQITGQYMSNVVPNLFNKQAKRIECPNVVQSDFHSLRQEIDRTLDKISSLYLKSRKLQKPSIFGQYNDSLNISGNNMNLSNGSMLNSSQNKISTTSKGQSKKLGNIQQLNSKILENLSLIQGFFQNRKIKSAKLLFRASENDFSIKKFHEICDKIPDTLTLIHNQFGKKMGGYTPVGWASDKKHWVADKSLKSFIFSLDMGEKFKLNLAQFAIACNPQRGPTFGCCDICIVDRGDKQKSNCQFPISYNTNGKYTRNQNTSQLFTGNVKGQFLIKQWQVFQLQFESN